MQIFSDTNLVYQAECKGIKINTMEFSDRKAVVNEEVALVSFMLQVWDFTLTVTDCPSSDIFISSECQKHQFGF